jgi:N-acetylmuramoyl-L-alanine amidase
MRATWRAAVRVLLAAILLGCCSCAGRAAPFAESGLSSGTGSSAGPGPAAGSGPSPTGSGPTGTPGQAPGTSPEPVVSGAAGTTPAANGTAALPSAKRSPARPLAGKIIGIDPGHDGGNFNDPTFISQLVWNGVAYETCDTTGTATATGYTEAQFNFNVATDLRRDLRKDGASVVMTRTSNNGVGPCVNRRAQIIDAAHASVAIDIHADGGPSWGRGFTVLEPVSDGPNNKVIAASARFGADVRAAFLKYTSMPVSDYYGKSGIISRDDLAGLNLTSVPKVLVECGNMPNPTDAAMLTSPSFQRKLASALTAAIVGYLTS